MLIKYLGSKRRLVPALGEIAQQAGAETAVDLFTGTTRVGQEFKRRGMWVTTCDTARYSEIFSKCYIDTDATTIDKDELIDAIYRLNEMPGQTGYVTKTFCEDSRYFQPFNGERIDAIRQTIEDDYKDSWLYPILMTSLIEAADRVDSTTGQQMAYVKSWATRSYQPLRMRTPELLPGSGRTYRGDACQLTSNLEEVDLAYLDPPYNQHRYYTNYHIWETLVAWDAPETYGIACKRVDSRDESTKSVFNMKRAMPDALRQTIRNIKARVVVVSYNNEAWIELEDLVEMCSVHGWVEVLAFDSKRYVGAQIGIYNPSGSKVGRVSHLRNVEYVLIAGAKDEVCKVATPLIRHRFNRDAEVS